MDPDLKAVGDPQRLHSSPLVDHGMTVLGFTRRTPVNIIDRRIVERSREEARRNQLEPIVEIFVEITKKDSRTDS